MSNREVKKLLGLLMKKELSDDDIYNAVKGKTNIVEYSRLKNVKKIEDIMKNGTVVILYELKSGSGHWTLVSKVNKDVVEFFDSYSLAPDDELKWINPRLKKKLNSDYPHIMRLLLPYKEVKVLPYRLQKMNNNVSTCGRYIVHRIWNRHIPLMRYHKMVKKQAKKMRLSNDEFITLETMNI